MVEIKMQYLVEQLFKASPYFQRSINIKYDLMSEEYIDFFFPTLQSSAAFDEIARSCISTHHQRAHIFVGPYGSGKSIFAVTLAALLAKQDWQKNVLENLVHRISHTYPELSEHIINFSSQDKKFLPVVLSGDEGPLTLALTRALMQSLRQFNLEKINPPTMYQAIEDRINQWKVEFPEVYKKFSVILNRDYNIELGTFIKRVKNLDVQAYGLFCKLHPKLSAGAEFNHMFNQSPVTLFEQVGKAIKPYGYDGIVILYDEFGLFLERRIGKPKSQEAQLLQELAEYCNRSSNPIIHLIAISHKVMTQYAQGLNDEVKIEWQRIEGRFKTLSLAGDSKISFQLLERSLKNINQSYQQEPSIQDDFQKIISNSLDLNIVDNTTEQAVSLFTNCFPLHPLTTYCLPELSNKIAQNERTLFTFLFGRDEHSLSYVLEQNGSKWPIVTVDSLYDYFNEAMKFDNGPGGTHNLWSSAEGILKKLNPSQALVRRMVKALAILHAVRKGYSNRPSNELLAFAVGVEVGSDEFTGALQQLVDTRMVFFRGSTACWEFVQRSEIDIDLEITSILAEVQPNHQQLKNYMEKVLWPVYYPARKYNDEYGTIRYFTGCYYTVYELKEVNWQEELNKREYADGLVIYVLASNQAEAEEALQLVKDIKNEQVIFVLPESYMNIYELLEELFALEVLKEKINSLREQDPRVEQEVQFLFEDCLERTKSALSQLTDPSASGVWYHNGDVVNIQNFSGICRYVSDICGKIFNLTPKVYNEALNRREPSGQQIKATQKLIDGLFQDVLLPGLGLTGSGPEMAIYKTVLKAHNLVEENNTIVNLTKPTEENLRNVWIEIENYIYSCNGEGLFISDLVKRLQLPPYGIRKGIMPVLIAVVFARYIEKIALEYQGHPISPITSKQIIELVKYPDKFKIKFFDLDQKQKNLLEALVISVDCNNKNFWQTKQILNKTSELLNTWLLGLSVFAKSTTAYLSKDAVLFRKAIKDSRIDPFKELLITISSLMGAANSLEEFLATIQLYVIELNAVDKTLLKEMIKECRSIFGDEETEVNLLANTWWNNATEVHHPDWDNYRAGDIYSNILIKYCKKTDLSEGDWVKALANEFTGLDLNYWSDSTSKKFTEMLLASRERINREISETKNAPSQELVTVSFGTKKDQKSFTYRKTNLTPSAMKLLNTIKRTLDTTGKYLNQDERMELCTEILNYLIK